MRNVSSSRQEMLSRLFSSSEPKQGVKFPPRVPAKKMPSNEHMSNVLVVAAFFVSVRARTLAATPEFTGAQQTYFLEGLLSWARAKYHAPGKRAGIPDLFDFFVLSCNVLY